MKRWMLGDHTLLGVALCAIGVVLWSGSSWWQASSARARAAIELDEAETLLVQLRSARQKPVVFATWALNEDPLGMVKESLGQAGISGSTFRRVQPEAERGSETIPGTRIPLRRSAVRLELEALTLPEVGRFFSTWRQLNPAWTPVLINLFPRPQLAPSTTDQVPEWNVSIQVVALSLSQASPSSSVPAGERRSGRGPE